MKKKRFIKAQISLALNEYEQGKSLSDICGELSISSNTFYRWKNKYSGMDSEMLRKYKDLERENAQLKRMIRKIISSLLTLSPA